MPGHGRGRKRQGYARRPAGLLEAVLLLLLHYEPAHGYTLREGLDKSGLDAIDISAIYRTLRDMENRGWATSSWDEQETRGPPRRVYRITDTGDKMLATWMRELDETRKLLTRLVGKYNSHMEVCEGEHYPRAAKIESKEDE